MHMPFRLSAFIALVLLSLTSLVSASPPPWPQWPLPSTAPIIQQGRRGINPPSEFGLFFGISGDNPAWFNLHAGQVPFRQDIVLIPASATPLYPQQGPHMIENYPGGRPAFYAAFIPQLQNLITGWITRADFDGLLILDYEFFCPWWTGHFGWPSNEGPLALDYDFRDDWREALSVTRAATLAPMNAAQREEYFKQEWMSTTREFFERTVAAVRAVRPLAKVGIYNQPTQSYWDWVFPMSAHNTRLGHDEVPWFWQLIDVVIPSVYCFYQSIPDGQVKGPGQDYQSAFDFYVRNNISEALRCANGKPVYPYVSFVYHSSNAWYGNQNCNTYNLQRPLQICREMGCNGALVWGWFRTQQEYDTQAPFFDNTVVPFLEQFSTLPAVPFVRNNCPADVGSQGGVAGPDGLLNQNDFIVFLNRFFTSSYLADVGRQGGLQGSDGILNNNDFIAYVDMYMNGCR